MRQICIVLDYREAESSSSMTEPTMKMIEMAKVDFLPIIFLRVQRHFSCMLIREADRRGLRRNMCESESKNISDVKQQDKARRLHMTRATEM
uniref:Uncharacterized protein n=1 Tax=Pristionchus pacificus TaxID=54126 RepID=A0A2A6C479_PRIPA|eukprot:PDM72985.1 hypothetical protein PRIPAC_39419 [Pristionchus pacificus]